MKIAYGVMGYGRGHASRTSAVLPALMREHEVTVFAGGDAHALMRRHFDVVEIPTLGYVYDRSGRQSLMKTISGNAAHAADLMFYGQGMQQVEREFRRRGIDLVISDSEAWTHRVARRMRLPRISFDHVGIIAWCRPHFPDDLLLTGLRDGYGYRQLMGEPERILIASFYDAEPARPGVQLVGPILRDEVLGATPTRGEELLVYLNRGDAQWRPQFERALRELELPVRIYGTTQRGSLGNLQFCAIDTQGFVRDMAACRAVIATAGSQLIGEAIHLGKPILALPEDAFEQQLNARLVERMGIGLWRSQAQFCTADVEHFLADLGRYAENMKPYARNGRDEALLALRRFIEELHPSRRYQRSRALAAGLARSKVLTPS